MRSCSAARGHSARVRLIFHSTRSNTLPAVVSRSRVGVPNGRASRVLLLADLGTCPNAPRCHRKGPNRAELLPIHTFEMARQTSSGCADGKGVKLRRHKLRLCGQFSPCCYARGKATRATYVPAGRDFSGLYIGPFRPCSASSSIELRVLGILVPILAPRGPCADHKLCW